MSRFGMRPESDCIPKFGYPTRQANILAALSLEGSMEIRRLSVNANIFEPLSLDREDTRLRPAAQT